MTARIYKPTRTSMQSGTARTKNWVLEFAPSEPLEIEPLMGWTSSTNTERQVRLMFDTKEEAVAYAERAGVPFEIYEPKVADKRRISYSDNFKWGRVGQWTH